MANTFSAWGIGSADERPNKIHIQKDTRIPNAASFIFVKEDHTLANILRSKLLENKKVLFAGYKIAHPLEPEFVLRIHTTSETTPLDVLQQEIVNLMGELRDAEIEFEKELKLHLMN